MNLSPKRARPLRTRFSVAWARPGFSMEVHLPASKSRKLAPPAPLSAGETPRRILRPRLSSERRLAAGCPMPCRGLSNDPDSTEKPAAGHASAPAPTGPGADPGKRARCPCGWLRAISLPQASGLPPREPGRLRRARRCSIRRGRRIGRLLWA